jgi:hypothetical protein
MNLISAAAIVLSSAFIVQFLCPYKNVVKARAL